MRWETMKRIEPLHNSGLDSDYDQVMSIIQQELDEPQVKWNSWSVDFVLTVMRMEFSSVKRHRTTFEAILMKAREVKVGSWSGSLRGAYMEQLLKQVSDNQTPIDGNFTATPMETQGYGVRQTK